MATYFQWEAMHGSFADEFWKAAAIKVETLEAMDAQEVVEHTEDTNVLQLTQAYKLKCFPAGLIKKFKVQFLVREDQHIEGIGFHESYPPVVQWTTNCLMFILEVLLE